MPVPTAPHTRVTFVGALPGGEIWSSRFALSIAGGSIGVGLLQQAATLAAARARTWIAAGTAFWGPCTLTAAVVANVDINGQIIDQAQAAPATPVTGPAAQVQTHQTACVLTLQTQTPGPRGRGRMYQPALGAPLVAGGRLGAATRDSMLAAAAACLVGVRDDVAALVVPAPTLLVVSSTVGPALRSVTRIRCGDVLDTQRRRRDSLAEQYATFVTGQ